jgi:hypothetical protein
MSGIVSDDRHKVSSVGEGLMDAITYVGLDVHRATVCVALAESGRGDELRQLGVFQNHPDLRF